MQTEQKTSFSVELQNGHQYHLFTDLQITSKMYFIRKENKSVITKRRVGSVQKRKESKKRQKGHNTVF